jgi:segregation and condensation protein A
MTLEQPAIDSTIDVVDGLAFARLYGEPLFNMPTDLYIPPNALEVFLETFEGPLDLLLYLIRKQNFNVLDIPMAQVTVQYLTYVDEIKKYNLELAAEYLLMAAMLIEIKSRMLLPVKKSDTGEEVEDPRAELVRRLLEYEQMKLAGANLNQLPVLGRDFMAAHAEMDVLTERPLPNVDAASLQAAWRDILKRAKLNARHQISREALSVREFMTRILRQLEHKQFMEFGEIFNELIEQGNGRPILVVNFIAVLELCRESLIELTQAEPYAPIYVRLSYLPQ